VGTADSGFLRLILQITYYGIQTTQHATVIGERIAYYVVVYLRGHILCVITP